MQVTRRSAAECLAAAQLLLQAKKPLAALRFADKAETRDPQSASVAMLQASLRNQLDWLSGALESSYRALRCEPTLLHYRLGIIDQLMRHRDFSGAEMLAEEGLLLQPADPALGWALVTARLGRGDSQGALAALENVGGAPQRLASAYLRAGDFDAALAWAQKGQDCCDSLVLRGQLALWQGDSAKAHDLALVARDRDPDTAEPHALLTAISLARNDVRSAQKHSDDTRQRRQDHPDDLLVAGEIARKLADDDAALQLLVASYEAATEYNVALELNRQVLEYRFQVREPQLHVDEFLDLCQRAAPLIQWPLGTLVSPDSMSNAVERALDKLSGNRTSLTTYRATSTAPLARLVVAPDPRTAAMEIRGVLRVAGFPAAIDGYTQLIEQYNGHPLVFTHRGELLLWRGDYLLAADDFTAALSRCRKTVWAYIGLALTQLLRGHPDLCIATLDCGKRVVWSGPTTHIVRGEALRRLGQTQPSRAALQRASQDTPGRISAWINLAILELGAGQRDQAQAALGQAISRAKGLMRDLKLDRPSSVLDVDQPRQTIASLEHILVMMRGNRSSKTITYFTGNSRAHFIATNPNELGCNGEMR